MTDGTIQMRRRIALAVIVTVVAVWAAIFPGPRAKLELTSARVSLMFESGPLRFSALLSHATAKGLVLSIGDFTR